MAKHKAKVIPLRATKNTRAVGFESSSDDLLTRIFQSEFAFIIASDSNKGAGETGRFLKHGTKNTPKK
jgi:hypothetical protein